MESIQLSTQGSERQRKDLIRTALRFEKMLMHSAGDPSYQNLSQEAHLKKLFEAYNGFKANVAISKWQLSEDFMAGIINVIIGMSDESRQIVRGHLDFNEWEHSAYNESLLKSKRHTIGNTPRGLDQHFALLLTVTSESQAWFFKRYNSYFATSAKKTKPSLRSRIRWNQSDWDKHVDHTQLAYATMQKAKADTRDISSVVHLTWRCYDQYMHTALLVSFVCHVCFIIYECCTFIMRFNQTGLLT
ncbi:unnamed protein product [Polarella glacialis]|uniref:Uncharacterized protein n=1 Tax=Polarella glacialis TaxID=89957 RepID=A0A813IKD5_POLGL|nr:unnamed protein product [Polarella glacialis]CAE8720304.1 unnamed protein product [Polarella glacialis]